MVGWLTSPRTTSSLDHSDTWISSCCRAPQMGSSSLMALTLGRSSRWIWSSCLCSVLRHLPCQLTTSHLLLRFHTCCLYSSNAPTKVLTVPYWPLLGFESFNMCKGMGKLEKTFCGPALSFATVLLRHVELIHAADGAASSRLGSKEATFFRAACHVVGFGHMSSGGNCR